MSGGQADGPAGRALRIGPAGPARSGQARPGRPPRLLEQRGDVADRDRGDRELSRESARRGGAAVELTWRASAESDGYSLAATSTARVVVSVTAAPGWRVACAPTLVETARADSRSASRSEDLEGVLDRGRGRFTGAHVHALDRLARQPIAAGCTNSKHGEEEMVGRPRYLNARCGPPFWARLRAPAGAARADGVIHACVRGKARADWSTLPSQCTGVKSRSRGTRGANRPTGPAGATGRPGHLTAHRATGATARPAPRAHGTAGARRHGWRTAPTGAKRRHGLRPASTGATPRLPRVRPPGTQRSDGATWRNRPDRCDRRPRRRAGAS